MDLGGNTVRYACGAWLGCIFDSWGSFCCSGIRYVSTDLLPKIIRIFDELLLTVRRGTGLGSDGERCYNMVRY